ncbi:glycosyl hydrolase 108 family protein [Chthonobacter rhizosphaerae]|uniref:glycosyl hydrolase 108 family protein n=1 Tax=Chthonobacter rhizosphaerae TaxID=2735553 RepID=UPI0015EF5031|nr:glycosyl hydrolase 108 family protein [Chthonobacter rhizosphaerae]
MFEKAYKQTRAFEGGYANHPNDRGGATIFGISSKYWPEDFALVKSLVDQGRTDEAEAYTRDFYKKNFWDASGAENASPEMQPLIFDAAVNHGVGAAKRMFASAGSDPTAFLDARQGYMDQIVQNDPSQAVFQQGWQNRVDGQRMPEPVRTASDSQSVETLNGSFASMSVGDEREELVALRRLAELEDKAAQSPSFTDKVGQAVDRRASMAADIQKATRDGKQTKAEEIWQLAGKGGAGLAGDVAGAAISSGFQALPDYIEQPIRSAGRAVMDSPIGGILNFAAEQYGDFAQNHPRAARNVEATANMAGLAVPAKAAPSALATTAASARAGGLLADKVSASGLGLLDMVKRPATNAYDDLVRPVLPNAVEDPSLIARNQARAGEKLLQRLEQDGISLDDMQSLGNQSIYERGGENIERLGEAISQMPGKGATIARDYAEAALDEQASRVLDHVSRFVSGKTDYASEIDSVIQTGRRKASPLYDAAYEGNPSMKSKTLNRLLETPAGKAALGKARTKMLNDPDLAELPAIKAMGIRIDLKNMKAKDASNGLNLRTLDYVKRALDDQILAARKNPDLADDARIITNLKKQLVAEIDRLDYASTGGKYMKARDASRGYLEDVDAFETGQTFHKLTTGEIKAKLRGMSESERDLFRMGISKRIGDLIDNAGDNTNLSRLIVGKKGLRERLEAALGPEEYAQLKAALDGEKTQFIKAQRLKGGSRTSRMQSEKEDLSANAFDALQDVQRRGILGTVSDRASQYVAGRYVVGNEGVSEEIARVLFERDPTRRDEMLKKIIDQSAKKPKKANGQKAKTTSKEGK